MLVVLKALSNERGIFSANTLQYAKTASNNRPQCLQPRLPAWKTRVHEGKVNVCKKRNYIELFLVFQVVAEVATPVASCAKVTMVSTGDAPIGIQKMTREILGVVKDLPDAMHDLTGVDITKVTCTRLTSCSESANKPSTICVYNACYKLSSSLEQAINN